MNKAITILGIPGSLRRGSYNRGALRAAQELVPEGASLDVFELEGIPGFNQDEEQNPPAKVVELKKRVRGADAILFVTPEYNYSVMGASIGAIATAGAQYHLRQIMVFLNMFPINQPEVMIGNASERFDAQGNLTDDVTKDYIRKLLQSLVEWSQRIQPRQPG